MKENLAHSDIQFKTFYIHLMSRKLSLILSFVFFSTLLFAQESPVKKIKFGDISDAEMNYTSCDFEPGANAVILRDHGILEFRETTKNTSDISDHDRTGSNYGFIERTSAYSVLSRHKLVKILDDSASDLGDIRIYYSADNTVENIKAQSISPEGIKTPISKADIFYEEETEYYNSVRFAVSKLSANSLIEIKYELHDVNIITLPEWEFQNQYPTLESNLIVAQYEYLEYSFLLQGAANLEKKAFDKKHSNFKDKAGYKKGVTQFSMKNIPSIKRENFITNIEDHRKKIRFQLLGTQFPGRKYKPYMSTWQDLSLKLQRNDHFGLRMNDKANFKNTMNALLSAYPDIKNMPERERYEVIYNFVRNNIESNGESGIFVDRKLDDAFNTKAGGIDEINFLIVALAKQCGLNAYPALTSTHSHGKLYPNHPFYNQFNYTFAYVVLSDGSEIFSDGADHLLGYDVLPYHLYNDLAFIIKDNGAHTWKEIKSPTRKSIFYLKGSLNEEGTLTLDYHINPNNIEAEDWRIAISNDENYVKNYLNENHNDISIETVENENVKDLSKKLKIHAKCSLHNAVDASNDMIYFDPVLAKLSETNPFVAEERQMPIDFVLPFKEQYILSLSIPKNYTVESLPKSEAIALEDGSASLTYTCAFENGTLTLRSMVEFKKAEYPAENYIDIKGMFEQIINKQSEMVVFKKI